MKKIPFLTLLLSAIALFGFFCPEFTSTFELSRVGFGRGEFWRLWTGHLTHFTGDHLKWDLAVFVGFGILVELRNRMHCLGILLAGGLAISLGIVWLQPQFTSYRGLSGIDSALFGYVAVDIFSGSIAERRWPAGIMAAVAIVLFAAKLVFEIFTGRAFFVEANASFTPVPIAHLIGFFSGAGWLAVGSRFSSQTVVRGLAKRISFLQNLSGNEDRVRLKSST